MSKRYGTRFVAVILALMLLVSGCGSTGNTNTAGDSSTAQSVGSTGSATSTVDNEPFTIKTSFYANEVSQEIIEAYQKENPNIKIEVVSADPTKLMAMLAAGNPVDLIRTQGINTVPSYVARGLALPLDSYIDKSTVIKRDDFAAVQALYQFDGKVQGQGPVYGFAKDWSVDTAIWINKKIFKDAGVEIPSPDKSPTYSELANLAKKLTKKENGKITVFGYVPLVSTNAISIALASIGKSLWSNDLKSSNFQSPEGMKVLQYFVDLQKEGAIPSSLNPLGDGWGGVDFQNDKIAMIQQGYWYNGFLKSNEAIKDRLSDFQMIPSPTWDGGKQISAVTGGTGAIVYSKTKNPDAVWKFMEFFFAGQPADDRAKGGWGLPSFKSKMSLVPNSTDFEKAALAVTEKEAATADLSQIKSNPFASETATDPIITKYLDPVLYGKAKLEDAAKSIDNDIKTLISDGMDIAGAK